MPFSLTLCELNPDIARAWARAFTGTGVRIVCGSITDIPADALVSPANSFGFMDGGIDRVYSTVIGDHLQERVQAAIRREHHGELLVGQALAVATDHPLWRWLIAAPTMRVPAPITDLADVFLATRAALRLAMVNGWSVAMPGMGTLTGRVPPDAAATAMRKAFDHALSPVPFPSSLRQAVAEHTL